MPVYTPVDRFSPRAYAEQLEKQGVYFLQSTGEGQPIKIGFSTNIPQRVKSIRGASPDELTHLSSFQGVGMSFERRLHRVFAPFHRKAEWFHPAPELLAYIDDLESGTVREPESYVAGAKKEDEKPKTVSVQVKKSVSPLNLRTRNKKQRKEQKRAERARSANGYFLHPEVNERISDRLTDAEKEIMALRNEGWEAQDIAWRLGKNKSTIERLYLEAVKKQGHVANRG